MTFYAGGISRTVRRDVTQHSLEMHKQTQLKTGKVSIAKQCTKTAIMHIRRNLRLKYHKGIDRKREAFAPAIYQIAMNRESILKNS